MNVILLCYLGRLDNIMYVPALDKQPNMEMFFDQIDPAKL
jgi:hypothetical protein